ncbi:MAG: hypothetical protein QW220_02475 [Candidatus Bathyarchaeia archaeon]
MEAYNLRAKECRRAMVPHRTLKDRTRRFYNNFQTKRGLFKVELFLRFFVLRYDWIRPHQALGRPPAIT